MSDVLETLKQLGVAVLDAWYVVDGEDRIVEHNAAFRELFPRESARALVGQTCRETVKLGPCRGEACLRVQCQTGAIRLDEQEAEVAGEKLRFILGAAPVELAEGKTGTLIILRNVTDEARVQARYQSLEADAEMERMQLEERLEERTRDLLAANEQINRLEAALARYKRGEF